MPKSTKKQKDKTTDFKKSKLKLGKGKKPASNAIDTSFKAHSIALPTQSITQDKSEAGPSTRRRHNLSELISLTRHYSAGSRKDALAGLRELFSAHSNLILSSASLVIPACSKLIADEDTSVRKALAEFLDWYLHCLPKTSVLPYAPTLLLFTTSAQSHIFPEIRVDAIHVLNILLDIIPAEVTSKGPSGYGDRVLQGYCSLLAGGSFKSETDVVNISATVLSAQSKLLVITSLERFLKASVQIRGSVLDGLWYLRHSFTSKHAHESFVGLVQQRASNRATDAYPDHISLTDLEHHHPIEHDLGVLMTGPWQEVELWDALDGCFTSSSGLPSRHDETHAEMVETVLHKFIVEVWLDNAPSAFLNLESNISKFAELRLVHAIVKLAQSIYYAILQASSEIELPPTGAILHLEILLSHLSSYLPLARNTPVKAEAENLIQQLDLMFCELLALALLQTSRSDESLATMQKSRTKLRSLANTHLERVSLWVEDTLRSKPTVNHPMGPPLSESVAKSISPVIWAILAQPGLDQQGTTTQIRLLQTLADQVREGGLAGRPRAVLIQFIVILNLLQKEPEYTGTFRIQASMPAGASLIKTSQTTQSKSKLIEGIFLHLPKVLWELGISHPSVSQTIIFLLLRCAQRAALDWEPSTITHIAQRLSPFFVVQHPNMGALYGPFNKFPATMQGIACQKLALDLAYSLCHTRSLNSRSGKDSLSAAMAGLAQSVNSAVEGTEHEAYWGRLTFQ